VAALADADIIAASNEQARRAARAVRRMEMLRDIEGSFWFIGEASARVARLSSGTAPETRPGGFLPSRASVGQGN